MQLRSIVCITLLVACAVLVSAALVSANDDGFQVGEQPKRKLAGGFGDDRPSDQDVQAAVTLLRDQIVQELHKQMSDIFSGERMIADLAILSYQKQVVAGTVYKVKFHLIVTGEEYVADLEGMPVFEAKIFRSLPASGGETKYELMSVHELRQ